MFLLATLAAVCAADTTGNSRPRLIRSEFAVDDEGNVEPLGTLSDVDQDDHESSTAYGVALTELDESALATYIEKTSDEDEQQGGGGETIDEDAVSSLNASSELEVLDGLEVSTGLPAQCRSATAFPYQGQRDARASSRGKKLSCDNQLKDIWYVYPGWGMPTSIAGNWRCGTHAPGYLTSANPARPGETKSIKVCFWWSNKCQWSNNIIATNCGDKYVYKLPRAHKGYCHLAYCWTPMKPPKQNCVMNSWGGWGACNKACGGGQKTRSRSVRSPAFNGGAACPASKGSEACNSNGCPLACAWGAWSPWQECSKECGGGKKYRGRRPSREAKHGGAACSGSPKEEAVCNSKACPINGVWAEWGAWGSCSKTCGGGEKKRSRDQKVRAQHGGKACEGEPNGKDKCKPDPCPINCVWAKWAEWEECSVTCGGGDTKRTREPKVKAQYGGKECSGKPTEDDECNTDKCPTTTTTTTTAKAKAAGRIGLSILASAVALLSLCALTL